MKFNGYSLPNQFYKYYKLICYVSFSLSSLLVHVNYNKDRREMASHKMNFQVSLQSIGRFVLVSTYYKKKQLKK